MGRTVIAIQHARDNAPVGRCYNASAVGIPHVVAIDPTVINAACFEDVSVEVVAMRPQDV